MSLEHTQVFLSFTLGGMEYGLDARQVREWRALDALGRFADGAGVVAGVAQSRGVIVPLVDMRAAFAGQGTGAQRSACAGAASDVIVLTLSSCVMGMVVERVNGVVALRPDQIRVLPCVAGAASADYLLGLGDTGDRRLILVDIDRLMAVGRERAPDTV